MQPIILTVVLLAGAKWISRPVGGLHIKWEFFPLELPCGQRSLRTNIPGGMKRNIIIKRDSKIYKIVVFEVLTAEVMKSTIFSVITPLNFSDYTSCIP
jgi:hypothetical protein